MFDAITPSEIRRTAIDVIVKPATFYQRMAKTGGLLSPLLFVVVMGVVTGLLTAPTGAIGLWGNSEAGASPSLGMVIFIPLMGVVGAFVGALIMMMLWKLMGSTESFETAFRCIAYSTAIWPVTLLIGLIPYIGTVIGTVWSLWLMICASSGAHNIPYRKALIVFGIIGAVWIFLSVAGQLATREFMAQNGAQIREYRKSLEAEQGLTAAEIRRKMVEFRKALFEKSAQN